MTDAVLDARALAVGPPALPAPLIEGVELRLAAGERVALVGPSGSGKTTLLRTLAGQLAPRGGHVAVLGREPGRTHTAQRAYARQVAIVAQKHDLVDALPVHANVMAGALGRWSDLKALVHLVRPSAADLQAASEALEAVGLPTRVLRAPTAQLSGGEQQRVAIARALVQAPHLLLADEPVASLDPDTARSVLDLLSRLARERGMGLVCSLHQPDLLAGRFDRVLELRARRLDEVVVPLARAAQPA